VQQQHREQSTQLGAAQGNRALLASNLKRPEDQKPHHRTVAVSVGVVCDSRPGPAMRRTMLLHRSTNRKADPGAEHTTLPATHVAAHGGGNRGVDGLSTV
jgi:hypothetical protein